MPTELSLGSGEATDDATNMCSRAQARTCVFKVIWARTTAQFSLANCCQNRRALGSPRSGAS